MKRMFTITMVALIVLATLPGCSTLVQVTALPADLKDNDVVNGLPFRSRERYHIKLYRLQDGSTYEAVDTKDQTASLANLDVLYVLHVKGGALSNGTVTAKMRSDNTFESLKVESTSKGQEALTALGKGFNDLADAKATRDKDASDKTKAADGDVVASEDSRVAALDAKQAADLAMVELAELPGTSTQAQRAAAEQKVVKLKLVANQMARRAGLQPPFPDAGG